MLLLQGSSHQRCLWNSSSLSAERHILYGVVPALYRFAYVCIEWLRKHTVLILSSARSRPSHDRFHKQLSLLVERFVKCVGSMSRRERFGLYWTHLHRVRELVLDILKGKLKKKTRIMLKGNANFILDRYRVTQKNGNFWKTQQKLKKSKKKIYWQKLKH